MGKNAQLAEINKQGQSIWYDNLSRDVLRSGELASLISQGVSGLTSNPTIFKKAIADTVDYDADILQLKDLGVDELCEQLMVRDVAAAADLLKPVFEQSKGADGYASIEVSPKLARDSAGTVNAAKRIWAALGRPNIMIKIPATTEGLPAIREVLALGINVNITLIFSLQFYEQVVEQYLSALEERAAKGLPVAGIASVASFFVSRVDSICEKSLGEAISAGTAQESDRDSLFGKIGIANSKVAYKRYQQLFGSDRFAALRAKGALVQRPLWASTGTKNATLSPVLYVEQLVGPDSVNTVPPATLAALLKGAKIGATLAAAQGEAQGLINGLARIGIPFDKLMLELQAQGVKLFAESYEELVESVKTKRSKVVT